MNTVETTARRGTRPSKTRRLVAVLLTIGTAFALNGCGRMGGGNIIRSLGGGNGQLLARAANGVALAGNITAQFGGTEVAQQVLGTVGGALGTAAQARGQG